MLDKSYSDVLTRGEFFLELLSLWEKSLEYIHRNPNGTDAEMETIVELESAIETLKLSFPSDELMNYEFYRKEVDDSARFLPRKSDGDNVGGR